MPWSSPATIFPGARLRRAAGDPTWTGARASWDSSSHTLRLQGNPAVACPASSIQALLCGCSWTGLPTARQSQHGSTLPISQRGQVCPHHADLTAAELRPCKPETSSLLLGTRLRRFAPLPNVVPKHLLPLRRVLATKLRPFKAGSPEGALPGSERQSAPVHVCVCVCAGVCTCSPGRRASPAPPLPRTRKGISSESGLSSWEPPFPSRAAERRGQ